MARDPRARGFRRFPRQQQRQRPGADLAPAEADEGPADGLLFQPRVCVGCGWFTRKRGAAENGQCVKRPIVQAMFGSHGATEITESLPKSRTPLFAIVVGALRADLGRATAPR